MTLRPPPSRRRRGALRLLATVAIALLACGHIAFWYLPRARTSALDPVTPAGDLLLSARGARLWVPFPHQSKVAALLVELASGGADDTPLPRFGPLRLPPARELAVARSADATTLAVSVYPTWAAVGRLAGALTGNPWLRAGHFVYRSEPVEVTWRGATWIVAIGEPTEPQPAASATIEVASATPRLAAAFAFDSELLQDPAAAPAALDLGTVWGLEHFDDGEAELVRVAAAVPAHPRAGRRRASAGRLGGPSPQVWSTASPVDACAGTESGEVALCWLESLAPRPDDGSGGGERALVLLGPDAPFDPHVWRLPSAAALVRGRPGSTPPRRNDLPAESLARRLDAVLMAEVRAGWEITALDPSALAVARSLADAWADPSHAGAAGPQLAVWVAPRPLRRAAREVEGAFENLPLVDPDDARSWRYAGEVLARLESVEAVTVLAGFDRIAVRWSESEGSAPSSRQAPSSPW